MSTPGETAPNISNPFDLSALDPNSYEAAPQAISNELLRITGIAHFALPLLGLPYEAHLISTESELARYHFNVAVFLQEQADELSTPQQVADIQYPTTGAQARRRVFMNVFHGLPSTAPFDELQDVIAARQQYMRTIRTISEYGVTLQDYYAAQGVSEIDESIIDLATQADREGFAQIVSLQKQYQKGERNG